MSIKLTSGTTAFTTTTILNSQTSTISLYTANKYIDKDITITVSAKSGSISANTIITNGNFTEEQQEQIKEYAKSIKDVTAELVELRENAYAKLSETLDEFTEDINEQKDAISSSINVLNNYHAKIYKKSKELNDLIQVIIFFFFSKNV